MEKEDPNLITVFICFLRSGLRFTRYDTNNVGLAFIEEIKKHNPNFKPVKVQQRERDQIYTVNAYPKEFEQLILSLIEEYRKKHKLEYRLKKPRSGGGRGGYNRGGQQGGNAGQRTDNQYRGSGNRGDRYSSRGEDGHRPRSANDQSSRQGGYRPRENTDENRGNIEGLHKPRREQNIGDRRNIESNKDHTDSHDKPKENLRPRRPRRENND